MQVLQSAFTRYATTHLARTLVLLFFSSPNAVYQLRTSFPKLLAGRFLSHSYLGIVCILFWVFVPFLSPLRIISPVFPIWFPICVLIIAGGLNELLCRLFRCHSIPPIQPTCTRMPVHWWISVMWTVLSYADGPWPVAAVVDELK